MKKILLLLLLSFTSIAHAQQQLCSAANPFMFGFGLNFAVFFTDEACKEFSIDKPAEYCGCLEKHKETLINKALTKSPEKYKEELKQERTKRLENIYQYLNYEVAVQEIKFKMKPAGSPQTGCTVDRMANRITKSLCPGKRVCPIGTPHENDSNKIGENAQYSVNFDEGTELHSERASVTVAKRREVALGDGAIQAKFQKGLADYYAQNPATFKKAVDERVSLLRKFAEANPESLSATDQAEIRKLTKDGFLNKPENFFKIIKVVGDAYRSKTSNDLPEMEEVLLELQLKESDTNIQNKLTSDYEKAESGACIDYENYKVFNSAPTGKDISKWADYTPKQMEEALNPKNFQHNANFPLAFFQNNPVIAKNAVTEDQRKKLAEKLLKFAKQNKGMLDKGSDPNHNVVINFAEFMKTDIKELNDNNKMMDLLQCDLLAQNFAAATASDPYELMSSKEKNELAVVSNNLIACNIQKAEYNHDNVRKPSLTETLSANDLFVIFDDKKLYGPKDDPGYKEFLAKNCGGFEEFTKKHVKKSCWGAFLYGASATGCKDRTAVRALDVKNPSHKKLLDKYYAEHPVAKNLNDVIEYHTDRMTKERMAEKTDIPKQDKVAHAIYDKEVAPKVDKRSIFSTENIFNPPASSNNKGGSSSAISSSIAQAVTQAQQTYNQEAPNYGTPNVAAAPIVPVSGASAEASESSSGVANAIDQLAKSNQPTVNPGQYIPPFLDNRPAGNKTEDKISSMDDVEDALGDLADATPIEKKEILAKTKEYLSTQDQTNKDIAELQNRLTKYENEKVTAVADNTKVAVRAPASVNAAPPAVSVPTVMNKAPSSMSSGSSFVSQSGSSTSVSPTVRAQEKAKSSYEKALNQMNERRVEELSLVVDKGSDFDFNSSPIGRSDVPGSLVIGKALESNDKLFAEISSSPEAMKAYLAQNLTEVPVDKVVSIKCKGAGCLPNSSEILLVITKGPNNKFSVRSVSRETQVARSHKFMDLKNEINKATR